MDNCLGSASDGTGARKMPETVYLPHIYMCHVSLAKPCRCTNSVGDECHAWRFPPAPWPSGNDKPCRMVYKLGLFSRCRFSPINNFSSLVHMYVRNLRVFLSCHACRAADEAGGGYPEAVPAGGPPLACDAVREWAQRDPCGRNGPRKNHPGTYLPIYHSTVSRYVGCGTLGPLQSHRGIFLGRGTTGPVCSCGRPQRSWCVVRSPCFFFLVSPALFCWAWACAGLGCAVACFAPLCPAFPRFAPLFPALPCFALLCPALLLPSVAVSLSQKAPLSRSLPLPSQSVARQGPLAPSHHAFRRRAPPCKITLLSNRPILSALPPTRVSDCFR